MSDAPLEPPSSALASLLAAERADVSSDRDGERAFSDLDGARERVLARLAATLGPLDVPPPPAPPTTVAPPAAPLPAPLPSAPATAATAGGLAGLLTKTSLGMLIAGLVIGSATTAAWLPRRSAEPLSQQPSSSGASPLAASSAGAGQAITEAKPASSGATEAPPGAAVARDTPPGMIVAPVVVAAPKAASPTRAEDGRDPDLERERALLDVARGALARQNGALALSSLDEHARRFPTGRLAEEREALRVRSLELAGRAEEAKRRREAFSSAYPDSFALPPPSASPQKEPRKEKAWPE